MRKRQSHKPSCDDCKAPCCRYIAVVTHTPAERDDYELMRWYLSHKGVAVYIDDGEWYVHLDARCLHLGRNNRCAIYSRRPTICAEYEHDECEEHSSEADPDVLFETVGEFERYFRRHYRFRGDAIVRKRKKKT